MNQNYNRKLAVVDLDGTLIKGQSQRGLVNYLYSSGYVGIFYMLRLNLWFVMYKLGVVDEVKKILTTGLQYIKGKTEKHVADIVDKYIEGVILKNVYPKSMNLIQDLHVEGYSVLMLSTAVEPIVSKMAKLFHTDDYLCTKLESINGRYTGDIEGLVLYGENKIDALKAYINGKGYSINDVVAYADHKSDIPMLRIVGKAYLVNPDSKIVELAKENNIGIIDLRI